jgi:hypothetical protein
MQQRLRLYAALAAIVCAALVDCNARAQLYNNEYTCVAGQRCCVGWPNSPDRVCGTYEELKSAAIRCNLYAKSLINPPWQLIHRCGVYETAAIKVEGIQRFNAQQEVEREQAKKLLDQLNRTAPSDNGPPR